jgi:hypothetical protein
MTFNDDDVESMLRSMFFMAAIHGAFLVNRGQWNWENRMKYENACVKFLMERHLKHNK